MIEAAARHLADFLGDAAPLWRPAPFHDDPPWVRDAPAVAGALLSLADDEVTRLEQSPAALHAFIATHLPLLAPLGAAADACVTRGEPFAPPAIPETAGRDVPGRKWQQLLHFTAACGAPAGPVVDWCSGKAHLGRLLARVHGVPVTALEHDAALCREGASLAARERLPVTFIQADALAAGADTARLAAGSHAVALHACGDLHLALLATGRDAGIAAFDVAPCCYHLTRDAHWSPLSEALRGSRLAACALRRDDLRLAVQETVTSSPRVVGRQQQLAAWRLGFDRLQRDVRGVDTYLPTPPRPARVLDAGFAAFCRDLAAHHGMALPPGLDYDDYAQRGATRQARVRRLELLRHAFRRPLEVALVADRALFLAEGGYQVTLQTFCPRALTPRNLLIRARLTAGQPGQGTSPPAL